MECDKCVCVGAFDERAALRRRWAVEWPSQELNPGVKRFRMEANGFALCRWSWYGLLSALFYSRLSCWQTIHCVQLRGHSGKMYLWKAKWNMMSCYRVGQGCDRLDLNHLTHLEVIMTFILWAIDDRKFKISSLDEPTSQDATFFAPNLSDILTSFKLKDVITLTSFILLNWLPFLLIYYIICV